MKKVLLFFGGCLVLAGCASPGARSSQVQCKPARDEENQAAREAIRDFLASREKDGIPAAWASDMVTCGPHLWAKVKDAPPFAGRTFGGFSLHSATIGPGGEIQEMQTRAEATTLRDAAEVCVFWQVVRATTRVSDKCDIRRATPDELQALSAQVPFVLEEPIFVVAGPEAHLIIVMLKEGGACRPFWVEDVFGVSPRTLNAVPRPL